MESKKKIHPIRGFFAGLCLGVGAAILVGIFGLVEQGSSIQMVVAGLGVAVGILFTTVGPAKSTA